MVIGKIKNTIKEKSLIDKGDHIVIGVSGGPDSICLLHALYSISDELDISLHAVHINHCLRGEEADKDQIYTERFCENLGIPCHVFIYDINKMAADQGLTTEEMGRNARYEAFEKVRKEIMTTGKKSVKIAVAQNQNDQAETLLMRIIRGTGTDGLAAIEYKRDDEVIRPLLDVSREEIEEYCRKNNLEARIDKTNYEPMYTRNKIRLELIPYLKDQYNESIIDVLSRLSQIVAEDKDFIYSHVDETIQRICTRSRDKVYRNEYKNLHPAIGKRVISSIFKEMGLIQDISAVHLINGDKLIREGNTGDQIDFPRGYLLRISYDMAEFIDSNSIDNEKSLEFCYPIKIEGKTEISELNAVLKTRILEAEKLDRIIKGDPYSSYLDISDISRRGDLVIRSRRPGDFITPFGMAGTKKIQDFFVDEKIKRVDRDSIPLVCLGSEVLWVIGKRINEKYRVKDSTKEILHLEYRHLV